MSRIRCSSLLASLFVFLVLACSTAPPRAGKVVEPSTGRHDDPEARDRWYWEQRAYPAGSIPIDRHRDVLRRELAAPRLLGAADTTWTNLGPAPLLDLTYGEDSSQNSSGRALTLAIHPNDPNTLLLGTAQGGIWKSTDRGASWRAVGELTLPTLAVNIIRYNPADANVLYAGTGEPNGSTSIHGAGILKSIDGGESWTMLPGRGSGWNFEYAAITGLQFDARDPATMYATTATIQPPNTFFRTPPNPPQTGIFKSTDGGLSWTLLRAAMRYEVPGSFGAGFMDFEYGGALAPDLLYVSEFYGGILRSVDGGASWRYVTPRKSNGLGAFPDDVPSISLLDRQTRRYRRIARVPKPENTPDFRRPEIGMSASNPEILYAGYDGLQMQLDFDGNGVFEFAKDRLISGALLFKSIDGGETWRWLGTLEDGIPDFCGGQCFYDYAISVDPNDPEDVWIGGSANYSGLLLDPPQSPRRIFEMPWRGMIHRSRDGGKSWLDTTPHCTTFTALPVRFSGDVPVYRCLETNASKVIHPDIHAIIFGPNDSVYVANDGGLYRTTSIKPQPSITRGKRRSVGAPVTDPYGGLAYTWQNLNNNLSTLQFYRIGCHPTDPDILLGGMQDNSSGYWDGEVWHGWGGGDGTIAIFDPRDPQYVYLGTQFSVHRHDQRGNKDFSKGWNYDVFAGLEFVASTETMSFVPVFALDPVEPTITYGTSSEGLYRSVSRGENSKRLVPNQKTDGVPTWISVSPVDPRVVWIGTSTGTIYRYDVNPANETATMTRVDSGLPNRYVSRVMAGHENAATVYAVFNGYDANTPSTPGKVFVSTDSGGTWRNVSGNLPDVPATAIALDPHDVNRIWLSTDAAVYSTADRGATWQSERRNMPVVAIQDLEFNATTGYLVAATHGRGVWRMRVHEGQ